ncbi:energy transducer TonB [Sphingomonas sp. C3-2]|uniref:TonB-dependent receptor plug domain-containing protein n=1 Tax=Sphingomonas sp. C3-2 TaxID=3062169 RepID=UPI00294AE22E|nr:energy transducer TonB [Sphingomonas sp. C3-2]WOK36287.1 energy transducer TonB [Sphingomonas sp. C3-2]
MTSTKAVLALTIAGAPFLWSTAQAQGVAALPEVVAQGETIQPPARLGTGVETGTTTIERQDIELRAPGSGDVNQLLKIAPSVQFKRAEGLASRDNIQDLRPSNLSISGGMFYDNRFTLDGIAISSRVDVTNTNPQNGSELAGATSQALWLDAELIGKITLRDSNVSAEHGSFTGGALAIETRDPRRSFGVTGTLSYTEDGLTKMRLSEASRDALDGQPVPLKPIFDKWRIGSTVDLPLGDRAALLIGYNRSQATVTHYANSRYGNAERRFTSSSDNLLVRGIYDIDPATKLTGQFSYTPYSSESSTDAAIDAVVHSKSGGYSGKVELDHQGDFAWKLAATYSRVDTGRTAPQQMYNIPSSVANGSFCSSSTCTLGGIGRLDQTEESFGLNGRIETEIGAVRLRAGGSYEHVGVVKQRPDAVRSYSRGVTGANIVCADGDDLDCAAGEYALGQYNLSAAYRATVDLDAIGAWAELEGEIGRLTVRGGVRYDYESYLGNHVFAPRLALAYALPWDGWELSFGANRYYGMSMVGYALREQYPSAEIYVRTPVISNGNRVYSDNDWVLSSISNATTYNTSTLETPYSDELTAAVSGQVLEGVLRVKGIYRDGRNAFVRSPMQTYVDTSGGTAVTRRFFEMTNDGKSSYRALSAEWQRSFGDHAVGLSVNYSRTRTLYLPYFESSDDELFDAVPVIFEGEIVTISDVFARNRRADYASPLTASATWSARWLDGRVRTNLSGNFRDGFRRIEDTLANETIDGVRYDVYAWKKYSASFDIDLNVQADIVRSRYGTLTVDARISNLLNAVPMRDYSATEDGWQYGRAAWFGIKFSY